ncbi:MAG: GNAT family N-acetyltransferase [Oscillospiraceae bacterium]|nr:GNAT family N-acetyltransferase [Oscillospiraceae bacterium]
MEIRELLTDKKRCLPLLLLADEQEDMIDRYLARGTMYVLDDGGIRGVCVITDEGDGILEIKNLAVHPAFQGRGYGKQLVQFVRDTHASKYRILQVGTSPHNLPFYEACGFQVHHIVKGFFTEHYDHPIYEDSVQLTDMIYLRQDL